MPAGARRWPDDGGAEIAAYAQLFGVPPPSESSRWLQQDGRPPRLTPPEGEQSQIVAGQGLTIQEEYGFE